MSTLLDGLFDGKHAPEPSRVRGLGGADMALLTDVVAGRSTRGSRVQALHLLATGDPAKAVEVLADLLRDADEDAALRAQAAAALGRVDADAAESALLAGLTPASEVLVKARIAQALGKVGSARARRPLEALARDDARHVQRQANFARTLVAFRHGLPWATPAAPGKAEAGPGTSKPLDVRPATQTEVAEAIDRLAGDTYRMRLDAGSADRVVCAGRRLVVIPQREATAGDAIQALTSAPRLLALVVGGYPEERVTEVDWLVLSWPGPEGALNLVSHAPDGTRVWGGIGAPDWPAAGLRVGTFVGHRHPIVSLTVSMRTSRLTITDVRAQDPGPDVRKRRPARDR